jgi:hypothetical protein
VALDPLHCRLLPLLPGWLFRSGFCTEVHHGSHNMPVEIGCTAAKAGSCGKKDTAGRVARRNQNKWVLERGRILWLEPSALVGEVDAHRETAIALVAAQLQSADQSAEHIGDRFGAHLPGAVYVKIDVDLAVGSGNAVSRVWFGHFSRFNFDQLSCI